jgi:aminopeptidase N
MVPPYRAGHGWIINQPALVGEHLAYDQSDYDVYLRVSASNANTSLAAGGTREVTNGWRHYRQTNARNFAWSVGHYETISTTRDGIEIISYVFPENAVAAQDTLETSAKAIVLFSELFTPYPHNSLTIIEADFHDGMEFDGVYFLDQGLYQRYNNTPREYLIPIAVHETAHQWWQGVVGSDQAQEPWLDEALATYSELLFYETYYPELVGWWWEFRVNRFDPTGQVNSTIYDFDHSRPYIDTVYLHGVNLLHTMRLLAGDDLFFAFLQDYAQAGTQTEQLTGTDFWNIWENRTDIESETLRQDYFTNPDT